MKNRICPRCKKTFTQPPALSRRDNKTEICPKCGALEAAAAAGLDAETIEEILQTIEETERANNE